LIKRKSAWVNGGGRGIERRKLLTCKVWEEPMEEKQEDRQKKEQRDFRSN